MELFALTFASGWASGLNAWATLAVLGLLARFTESQAVPAVLGRTDVLIVVAVLALLELVADKVPGLDSLWDAFSTAVRPVVGAVLAVLLAAGSSTLAADSADPGSLTTSSLSTGSLTTVALAALGGGTALASHLAKSGLRLAINTSPEPVSNVAASVANDVSLVGVLALALASPLAAAGLAAALLVTGLVLLGLVQHQLRRGLRSLRGRLSGRPAA